MIEAVKLVILAASLQAAATQESVQNASSPSAPTKPERQNLVDPREFGATGDGKSDDTEAFRKAIYAARVSGRPVGGTGIFRIDGTLDPAGVSFVGSTSSYTRNSTHPSTWGFVIEHNSNDSPLFQPTACGMLFHDVVLYDPRQSGAGITPKIRPPMFKFADVQCTDMTFENSVVVNAYDLFRFDHGAVSGDWRVRGNRIYAIRYGLDVAGAIPEVMFLSDNIWSPGVWQKAAVYGNGAMLAKWTGRNGAVIHIDSGSYTTDGLKSNNEFVFAYRNYLDLKSGGINVSSITGTSFDQVPQPLSVTGNAMVVLTITGGSTYARFFGKTDEAVSSFSISGNGVRRITLLGHSALYSSNEVLDVSGSGIGSVEWQGGDVVSFGQAAPASAAFRVDAPTTNVVWSPAITECSKPDQHGAIIVNVRTFRTSSTFSGCALALDIQATPAMVIGMDNSSVSGTVGDRSYRSEAGERFKAKGFYDKP